MSAAAARISSGRGLRLICAIVLGIGAAIALAPILLMILNAFKTSPEIINNPLALPHSVAWQNFVHAWQDAHLGTSFLHSLIVSGLTIVFVCATAAPAAYALARRRIGPWRGVSTYFLATTTAPIQLFLFPLYFAFAHLGLINNLPALALIYCAIYSPFSIFLLRTFFLAVPLELEEAALVDGATVWQVFRRVVLPIVTPGLLTVSLIVGLYSWNEFLIATTFLQGHSSATLVVSFYLLSGQYTSDWGEIMAAALLIVLPVAMFFIFLQQHFIDGMAGGAVKG
jgi:raffinose/stachyose/melibiose transport system permease protein